MGRYKKLIMSIMDFSDMFGHLYGHNCDDCDGDNDCSCGGTCGKDCQCDKEKKKDVDEEEPKNNDGRKYCYWCSYETKKVGGISPANAYDVCTNPKCPKEPAKKA